MAGRKRSRRAAQRDYNELYRQKLGEVGRPTKQAVAGVALDFLLRSIMEYKKQDRHGQADKIVESIVANLGIKGYDEDASFDVIRTLALKSAA